MCSLVGSLKLIKWLKSIINNVLFLFHLCECTVHFLAFPLMISLPISGPCRAPFLTHLRKLDDQSWTKGYPEITWWFRCQECWVNFRLEISVAVMTYLSNEIYFWQYYQRASATTWFLQVTRSLILAELLNKIWMMESMDFVSSTNLCASLI